MNRLVVHESWGHPRRISHTCELHEVSLWKVAGLAWVIVTSIIGNALIIRALWEKF